MFRFKTWFFYIQNSFKCSVSMFINYDFYSDESYFSEVRMFQVENYSDNKIMQIIILRHRIYYQDF